MNTITVEELEWLLERGEADLLDVRPEEEFRRLHVDGAHSLPLSQLEPNSFAGARRGNESFPLCLMCDQRLRASLAAGVMAGAGLANLCVLDGGLQAWVKEGLPVVRPHGSPTLRACWRTLQGGFGLRPHFFGGDSAFIQSEAPALEAELKKCTFDA